MITVLDLETTWVDYENDKIIEVALLKFDEKTFKVIDTFETLINPQIHIPEITSNITNIFDEDVIWFPTFDNKIIQKIKEFIGESPILGHNINFDINFLLHNWVNIEKNLILDTFDLSNIIFFFEKSLNLWSLCQSLNINLFDAHRAMDDVKATFELFKKLVFRFRNLDKNKKELINFLFLKTNSKVFDFYRKLFLFDDIELKQEEFIKKILKIIKKENLIKNKKNFFKDNLDKEYIKNIFMNLPNVEFRQDQIDISFCVLNSLEENKKIWIDALIWVWKTFVYLIPSIFYSIKNWSQVIISTDTKNFQDQIFKDLEFLNLNLKVDFVYTKIKWRKNYISLYRFFRYIFSKDFLEKDEIIFFSKIILWFFETDFWELDELNFYPQENIFLEKINADSFVVFEEENEYKEYEYILKIRKKAEMSNIVVVNHSFLIQDFIQDKFFFKKIDNLIIDEASNLEDAITYACLKKFSLSNLDFSIKNILNICKKTDILLDDIDTKFSSFFSQISSVFDLLLEYTVKKNVNLNDKFSLLLQEDFFLSNENLSNLLDLININFMEICNLIKTLDDKKLSYIKEEFLNIKKYLDILNICLKKENKKTYIPIFSISKNGNNTLSYTVLDIWDFLRKNLWNKVDSIILISPVLKVNNDFFYIKNTLNLNDFEFISFESNFDYSKQVLFFIPNDLGSIKYKNAKIQDFILKFLTIVKWKTLILFTNFSSIKEFYLDLNIPLKKIWIKVLPQWIWRSKYKIINHFKNNPDSSIIFWMNSFLEWADISLDHLKYLIIYKFPFSSPIDPIFMARSKLYKDPFRDYSIPQVIIKTKQWFLRFMKKKKDTWIVILLDDRYYNTDWGSYLRFSFPNCINIKSWNSKYFLDLLLKKINLF